MQRVKLIMVSLLAVFAFSAVAVGSAQAFNHPTWRKGGAATATNTKLNIIASSLEPSRLWDKKLGTVVICQKSKTTGTIENHENAAKELEGVDEANVTYEECTVWSITENAAEQIKQNEKLAACKVRDNVEKVNGKIVVPTTESFLAYVPGSGEKEVVDVFQPKTSGNPFVTLEITGTGCIPAGTYAIKGSVIGKIPRVQVGPAPTEEAVMGNLLFETNNEPGGKNVTQRFLEYELNHKSESDILIFGASDPAALESSEQVELESLEPFGVHN